jgi:hypothetical protein
MNNDTTEEKARFDEAEKQFQALTNTLMHWDLEMRAWEALLNSDSASPIEREVAQMRLDAAREKFLVATEKGAPVVDEWQAASEAVKKVENGE